jgi:hypothetical protein
MQALLTLLQPVPKELSALTARLAVAKDLKPSN